MTTMIQIRMPTTVHRPGPKYIPCEINAFTDMPSGGNYDIEVIPPFEPFFIEEEEGRSLVKRFEHRHTPAKKRARS